MTYTEELNGKTWTASDAMASETEVGEFLYGLVRLLKPSVAVETGCYKGDTSFKISLALKENESGKFFTCDVDPEHCKETAKRIFDNTEVWLESSSDLAERVDNVDFAFLDSSGDRFEEAKAFKLSPGAIVVLHDARRPVFEQLKSLGWNHVFLPTPRGLAVFQVPA